MVNKFTAFLCTWFKYLFYVYILFSISSTHRSSVVLTIDAKEVSCRNCSHCSQGFFQKCLVYMLEWIILRCVYEVGRGVASKYLALVHQCRKTDV